MEIFGVIVGIVTLGIIIALIIRANRKKKAAEEAERQRLAALRQKAIDDALKADRAKASAGKTFGTRTGRFSNSNPNLKTVPGKNSPEKKKYAPSSKNDLYYDDNATTNAFLFGAIAASTWDNGSSSSSSYDSGSSSSSYDSGSSSSSSYDSGSSSSFDSGSSGGW